MLGVASGLFALAGLIALVTRGYRTATVFLAIGGLLGLLELTTEI